MIAMTTAAVLALANTCVGPSLAPIMTGIAQHESGLDPTIVHHNANGTVDVGLAQVNSANFGWLGLTMQTALDPCSNLAAGARVLLVRYNGNPPDTVKAAYASAVTARIHHLDGAATSPVEVEAAPCPAVDPTGWRVAAVPDRCRADTSGHADGSATLRIEAVPCSAVGPPGWRVTADCPADPSTPPPPKPRTYHE
jgi:hypothetical protein